MYSGMLLFNKTIITDCTVEVEFLPAQEDSLSYLFMTFEKDGTEWKISSYGLEK